MSIAAPGLLEVNLADWTRKRSTSFSSDVSKELSPCLLLHVSGPWYVKTKASFVPEQVYGETQEFGL